MKIPLIKTNNKYIKFMIIILIAQIVALFAWLITKESDIFLLMFLSSLLIFYMNFIRKKDKN